MEAKTRYIQIAMPIVHQIINFAFHLAHLSFSAEKYLLCYALSDRHLFFAGSFSAGAARPAPTNLVM